MNKLLFNEEEAALINKVNCGADERILKFSILAREFSLIPLFLAHENRKMLKCPAESGWRVYCACKRVFEIKDFVNRNAGIACGHASRLIVVDVDSPREFKLWCQENAVSKRTLETFTVKTGGKGHHLYYQYPDRQASYVCTCVKSKLGKAIFDIKGIGGYVVAPGSTHPNGNMYFIEKNIPMLNAPNWVLDLAHTTSFVRCF